MALFRRFLNSVLFLAAFFASAAAGASPITSIIVIGDSLSDSGADFAATGGAWPPSIYYQGRFSNGPTAVELLASRSGRPITNFAMGGATTGTANFDNGRTIDLFNDGSVVFTVPNVLSGMQQQFAGYLAGTGFTTDPNALYVVWGGPNNFFATLAANTNPALLPAELLQTATAAITDLATYAGTLRALGAQHILVPNMPDISNTPAFSGLSQAERDGISLVANGFNLGIKTNIWDPYDDVVIPFDTNASFLDLLDNPAKYGLLDTTHPCILVAACLSDPALQDAFLFWDGVHPTAHVHAILAGQFIAAAGVPVPGSLVLMLGGLLALCAAHRAACHGRARRARNSSAA